MSKLFLGVLFFGIGQIIIWYQTNGQFLNKWAKDHPLMMSLIFGTLISYNFILGTRYIVEHFDGQLWPGRLVGFAIDIISFAIFTSIFMGESINTKTTISLILAIILVCIQVFWK